MATSIYFVELGWVFSSNICGKRWFPWAGMRQSLTMAWKRRRWGSLRAHADSLATPPCSLHPCSRWANTCSLSLFGPRARRTM